MPAPNERSDGTPMIVDHSQIPEDTAVGQIAALEKDLFGRGAWSEQSVRQEFHAPARTYLLDIEGDAVQTADPVVRGYAGYWYDGDDAEIMTIGVGRPYQRQGIAAALLETLIVSARRQGAKRMLLEVRVDNVPALALYERFGFTRMGLRKTLLPARRHRRVHHEPRLGAARRRLQRNSGYRAHFSNTHNGAAMSEPIVLGIESTCDETAAAVVQGRTLISNVVASSMDEHARYGGVIPEIASRAHAEAFVPCVSKALADANMTLSDVDAIAVSAGPGLAGCLAVGVSGAKSLAWAANKPIYGINHVIGHIAVTQLQFGPFPKDTLALIVSGGHTSLLHVEDVARHIDVVGTTLDDAAGECFDKVARLLGFPYPGGPHIDRHAQLGNPHAIKVPQGLTQGKAGQQHPYDFSFSGVKTAVARWIEQQQAEGNEIPVDDVCASLADSVATVLAKKAMRGCEQYGSKTLIVGGGFSANSQLRAKLLEVGAKHGVEVRIPQIKLCTDNGAMVAMLGVNLVESGVKPSEPDFAIDSAMPLTKISM